VIKLARKAGSGWGTFFGGKLLYGEHFPTKAYLVVTGEHFG